MIRINHTTDFSLFMAANGDFAFSPNSPRFDYATRGSWSVRLFLGLPVETPSHLLQELAWPHTTWRH